MNLIIKYPIKVYLSKKVWDDPGEYQSVLCKRIAMHEWILDKFEYPPEEYFCSSSGFMANVMGYIVVRFKTKEDAALFKLTWG